MTIESFIAQHIADKLWADEGAENRLGRLRNKLLHRMRASLVSSRDPDVTFELDQHQIILPLSHQLPFFRSAFPSYSTNLGRLAAAIDALNPGAPLIDIGANIGDSVVIMRSRTSAPILAIEGDAKFVPYLRLNVGSLPGVSIEATFVGEGSGQDLMSIRHEGTAYLQRRRGRPVPMESLESLLARNGEFLHARLLKSDTDGWEAVIIRTALEWLKAQQPVLFLEYDPAMLARVETSGLEMLGELTEAGYETALFYDNLGEPLIGVELSNWQVVCDLDAYVVGRDSKVYYDIAVFPGKDRALYESFRLSEVEEAVARRVRRVR
jgi:FkbM family methyltransferase